MRTRLITSSLLPATALALALASPAAAAGRAECEGQLAVHYFDMATPQVHGGAVSGEGELRCVGGLGNAVSFGHSGSVTVGQPAGWSGTCLLGELAGPIDATIPVLFGSAQLHADLRVTRAGGAWTVSGVGTVSNDSFFGSAAAGEVRITGTGVAIPNAVCADDNVTITLAVEGVEPGHANSDSAAPPSRPCAQRLEGTLEADRLRGTSGPDLIDARAGDDRASGRGGDDCVLGRSGRDVLAAGAGDDAIAAGTGADRVRGGAGDDRIATRDGSRDVVDCGSGRDAVRADRRDRVTACEHVLLAEA